VGRGVELDCGGGAVWMDGLEFGGACCVEGEGFYEPD